jgi:hypothetical protein
VSTLVAGGPDTGAARGAGRAAPIVPIGDVRWRTRARIRGRIRSLRVQPWANVATLECVVVDDTGGLLLVFLGRRRVAGVELGRSIVAEGMVGNQRGYLAIMNPEIELLV